MTDIHEGKLYSVKVGTELEDARIFEHELPKIDDKFLSVTAMTPLANECGIICALLHHGFAIIRIKEVDMKLEFDVQVLANPIEDENSEIMNDGRCSPDGRYFFVGTRSREVDFTMDGCYGKTCVLAKNLCFLSTRYWYIHSSGDGPLKPQLYRLDASADGSDAKTEVIDSVGHVVCSNGPNFSPDAKKFYFTCSINNAVMQYDYDEEKGQM